LAKKKYLEMLEEKKKEDTNGRTKAIAIKLTENEYKAINDVSKKFSVSKQEIGLNILKESGIFDSLGSN